MYDNILSWRSVVVAGKSGIPLWVSCVVQLLSQVIFKLILSWWSRTEKLVVPTLSYGWHGKRLKLYEPNNNNHFIRLFEHFIMVWFFVLPYIIVVLTILSQQFTFSTPNQYIMDSVTMYDVRPPKIFPTIYYNKIIFFPCDHTAYRYWLWSI